jgi:hypothetical protein
MRSVLTRAEAGKEGGPGGGGELRPHGNTIGNPKDTNFGTRNRRCRGIDDFYGEISGRANRREQ